MDLKLTEGAGAGDADDAVVVGSEGIDCRLARDGK